MGVGILESATVEPIFLKPELFFNWPEYFVFGIILVASLGIGVFYGFFGKKNQTNSEFLTAGRSMGIFPVTLSLICSFISAVALLGYPVEIYLYGTQYAMVMFSFPLLTLLLSYIYVPVYMRLELNSAFEYFEWRFSRRVRLLCSVFSFIYLISYMPTTVYGPSLALDQVAGINQYATSAAIFIVCIAYSSIGGLKAVLWTDALQGMVMLISLLAIIIGGVIEVGGITEIIERNYEGGRMGFFNMDFDPRTRHTIWTSLFGGLSFWLPMFAATQAQIQRYNSVPNIRTARITLFFNMVGLMIIIVLTSLIGMTIYAKYHDCDPITAKIISTPDQLFPLFVMEVLGKYPGLPGLLVGGLTCGTLSSVSSALNSLTANLTEDFVKHYYPNLTEENLAVVSKVISALSGMLAFCIIFPIAAINDTIQIVPFATFINGCLTSPVFGAFTLGLFFPWTNELGTLLAIICSIFITGYQGLGSILAGRIDGKLPDQRLYLTTESCVVASDPRNLFLGNSMTCFEPDGWKDEHMRDDLNTKIWSFAYLWLPGIGIGSTIVLGLIFSLILNQFESKKTRKLVPERLLSPSLVKFWRILIGRERMREWIEDESCHVTQISTTK